jgi:hypothetical protein
LVINRNSGISNDFGSAFAVRCLNLLFTKLSKCKIHVPKPSQLNAHLNLLTCNFLFEITYIYFEITLTSYEHEPEHVNQ